MKRATTFYPDVTKPVLEHPNSYYHRDLHVDSYMLSTVSIDLTLAMVDVINEISRPVI